MVAGHVIEAVCCFVRGNWSIFSSSLESYRGRDFGIKLIEFVIHEIDYIHMDKERIPFAVPINFATDIRNFIWFIVGTSSCFPKALLLMIRWLKSRQSGERPQS